MADYDKDVSIKLDVDVSKLESSLESAKAQITGAKEQLETIDDDVEETDFQIGAEPDRDSIVQGIANAKAATISGVEAAGPTNIEIQTELEDSAAAEAEAFKQAAKASEAATKAKDNFSESNKTASQRAKDSVKALDKEAQSFDKLDGFGESLTETKKAVAGANENVQKASRESVNELDDESGSLMRLAEALDVVEKKANSTSDSSDGMSDAFRRARARTDGMSDSMKAAAEVGDLFEDGLGSLSLNVGAFTIALRNFLTQVPLILTGLGAMGAAALGAASAFAALGGAMIALVGVGLLAHAQNLKDQFSQIESLGQSLIVIMRNLGDMMLRAIQPLLSIGGIAGFFTDAAEGVGNFVNMLSKAIREVTVGSDRVVEFAKNAKGSFITIREAIDSIDGSTFRNIVGALMEAWILLGEEAMRALEIIGDGLANAIRRSAELTNRIEGIGSAADQFGDTMSELAEVGFMIGGGLLPVFETFSSVVERVASFISNLDQEMVQNAVTIALLTVSFDKIIGTFGSILNLFPSVLLGLKGISTNAAAASGSLSTLSAAFFGASSSIFGFITATTPLFGGMVKLRDNLFTLIPSIRSVAFSSAEATKKFHRMALATQLSDDEMEELGDTMAAQKVKAATLSSDIDSLADEYRQLAIQGELTEDTVSEMDMGTKRISELNKLVPSIAGTFESAFGSGIKSVNDLNTGMGKVANSMKGTHNETGKLGTRLVKMSTSMRSVATASGATAVPMSLQAAATQALNASTIKAAILQKNFGKAIKLAGTQLATSTIQIFSYIAAQLGLIPSALSAAGATAVLDLAVTSLTGGLIKIVPAVLALIAVLGGLAVGVIKNADSIRSSLGGALSFISTIISGLVDLIMGVFIASWDALLMIFQPIIAVIETLANSFSFLSSSSENSASVIDIITTSIDVLQSILAATIRIIGVLGKFIVTYMVLPFRVMAGVTSVVIGKLRDFLALSEGGGGESFTTKIVEGLKAVNKGISNTMSTTEKFLNGLISQLNSFIKKINTVTGAGIATMDEVKLTRDEDELQSGGAQGEMEGEGDKNITYNEDNSTNIEQNVEADPEDKAQLSRVVSDAIDEANSFERRRQGGQ